MPKDLEILKKYKDFDPKLVLIDTKEASALLHNSESLMEQQRMRGEGLPYVKLRNKCRYKLDVVLDARNNGF